MHKVLLINGPNLNLLGTREPEIYGSETLDDVVAKVSQAAQDSGFELISFQSNHEGAIIDFLHEQRKNASAVIINPGGLTHTSVSLRDALVSIELPVYEVHLSNIFAREEFRHHSFISDIAAGIIAGMGTEGYLLAMTAVVSKLSS